MSCERSAATSCPLNKRQRTVPPSALRKWSLILVKEGDKRVKCRCDSISPAIGLLHRDIWLYVFQFLPLSALWVLWKQVPSRDLHLLVDYYIKVTLRHAHAYSNSSPLTLTRVFQLAPGLESYTMLNSSIFRTTTASCHGRSHDFGAWKGYKPACDSRYFQYNENMKRLVLDGNFEGMSQDRICEMIRRLIFCCPNLEVLDMRRVYKSKCSKMREHSWTGLLTPPHGVNTELTKLTELSVCVTAMFEPPLPPNFVPDVSHLICYGNLYLKRLHHLGLDWRNPGQSCKYQVNYFMPIIIEECTQLESLSLTVMWHEGPRHSSRQGVQCGDSLGRAVGKLNNRQMRQFSYTSDKTTWDRKMLKNFLSSAWISGLTSLTLIDSRPCGSLPFHSRIQGGFVGGKHFRTLSTNTRLKHLRLEMELSQFNRHKIVLPKTVRTLGVHLGRYTSRGSLCCMLQSLCDEQRQGQQQDRAEDKLQKLYVTIDRQLEEQWIRQNSLTSSANADDTLLQLVKKHNILMITNVIGASSSSSK